MPRREIILPFVGAAIFIGSLVSPAPQPARAGSTQPILAPLSTTEPPRKPLTEATVYLPLVRITNAPSPPLLIGVYTPDLVSGWSSQQNIDTYLIGLDAWAGLSRHNGKGHTIAGDFMSMHDATNVSMILETLWSNGYTAFINLWANATAAAIAQGQIDSAIVDWARAYKSWIELGGNRRAFIGALQEMNGHWIPYGMDPVNFKLAFRRIVDVFEQAGVPRNRVWWTFAPNGYSEPPYKIKDYYPGDAYVDIIAFSAYNFGRCPIVSWTWWQEPEEAFGPYIAEIRQTVSGSKPIFIAETASDPRGGDKDGWLRRTYNYLAQNNVRGVIYFNADKECEWAVYQPGGRQVPGYKDAVSNPAVRYFQPATLAVTPLAP